MARRSLTLERPPDAADPLDRFSPVAGAWFRDTFKAPTQAQALGWDAISSGEHTLLLAPTGSGKTLAAFLWSLDQLATNPRPRIQVPRSKRQVRLGVSTLYISPLKALSYDIERNLRAPLAGLGIAAAREGLAPPDIAVATRTGDTPTREREDIRRDPPDILITTPERRPRARARTAGAPGTRGRDAVGRFGKGPAGARRRPGFLRRRPGRPPRHDRRRDAGPGDAELRADPGQARGRPRLRGRAAAHILRLDVAVQDAMAMGGGEDAGDATRDGGTASERQRAARRQLLRQRTPLQELHDQKCDPAR
jgi:hypothetical protein